MLEEKLDCVADFTEKFFSKLLRHILVLKLCPGSLTGSWGTFEYFYEGSEDLKNSCVEKYCNQWNKKLFQRHKHTTKQFAK